jgi:ribose transport system ATP-binding protein
MYVSDKAVDIGGQYSAGAAGALGVSIVYQELSLCTNLTVAESFFLTALGRSRGWRRTAAAVAGKFLEEVFPGSGISVRKKVSALSLAERQMVEIARGVAARGLKVLVLDEPTSALSRERVSNLHSYLNVLRGRGVGIVYVSHKLDEVMAIVDRVTILRNGENHWGGSVAGLSRGELVSLLGGEAATRSKREARFEETRQPVLKCDGMSTRGLNDVTLVVYPGEIVGLAGLQGSGQRELLLEIYMPSRTARRALRLVGSAAYVSGDRQTEGIFYQWNVARNIIVAALKRLSRRGLVVRRKADEVARYWLGQLKLGGLDTVGSVGSLSGGNQQRVLIGRGFAAEAELLLFDDPMRGVDVGTKSDFYGLLDGLRESPCGVLWYSTEDMEFEYCDRVYVMRNGSIHKELRGEAISAANVIRWCFDEDRAVAAGVEA